VDKIVKQESVMRGCLELREEHIVLGQSLGQGIDNLGLDLFYLVLAHLVDEISLRCEGYALFVRLAELLA